MTSIAGIDAYSAHISKKTIWTFVQVRDSDGRSGWGEATLQGEHAAIHVHVADLGPAMTGRPAHPLIPSFASASASEAAAASAVDQALCDLTAQHRGVPIADMLGAPRRTSIKLYANINRGTVDRSPSGFAMRATEATSHGFDAIKIAPFDDVVAESVHTAAGRKLMAAGVERVTAVREAIGPDRRLLVDCHWRLSEAAARDVLRELEPAHLYWFECPLVETPAMFPSLRRLRSLANACGVRLAGCESMTGVDAFRSFLDAGVYDVVMPDVKYAGGLEEMLRIADAASACGASCSPHNPTGPIAHMHSVHVSSLFPELPFLEFQYGESPLFYGIVEGAMPDPRHGSSEVPRLPGLGIGLDMTKLSALLVQ